MQFKKRFCFFCCFAIMAISGTLAFSANVGGLSLSGGAMPVIEKGVAINQSLKSKVGVLDLPVIMLDPVASAKIQALEQQESLPTQIGFNRNVALLSTAETTGQQLMWQKMSDNSHVAAMKIISPEARALRVGMTVENLPEDAEFRYFGIANDVAVDIQLVSAHNILNLLRLNREADPTDPEGKVFWSPTVEGETLGIEIYLPKGIDPALLQVAFPMVSHVSILPFAATETENFVQGQGDSNSCQNDATCAPSTWSNLNRSVAGMIFSTNAGTYICTGSLLNDSDPYTWKPYFITANHCISSQAVASTLETRWFWQSATCNGSSLSSSYKMIYGGATLLHTLGMSAGAPTSSSMDTTLLRLNSSPPSGVYFAGWSAKVPPGSGTSRTGIHHPSGDWKKISYGTSDGDYACGWFDSHGFNCTAGTGNFYKVNWTDGGTEGGSSGSAFYSDNDHVIGTLTGGNGSCAGSSSYYSSFRAAYTAGNYSQWLNVTPDKPKLVSAPVNYLLLKGGKKSQWGAGSIVCCGSSSTTFSLSSVGVTKNSFNPDCSTSSTWEGWVSVVPGNKSFSWTFSSSGCGGASGSFSYTLSEGLAYYFQLEFDDPNLVIYVYTNAITNGIASSNAKIVNNAQESMQIVDKILLDIPAGTFTGSSCNIVE